MECCLEITEHQADLFPTLLDAIHRHEPGREVRADGECSEVHGAPVVLVAAAKRQLNLDLFRA